MIPAIHPSDESARLQALQELGLLDTPHEERFDRYVRLARQLFGVPMALISLVDRSRQWFKASSGLDVDETERSVSFCGHALLRRGVLYVPDAHLDARFADNPLVLGHPRVRFYAGAPLFVAEGLAMGALCVIDSLPRTMSVAELRALRDLADCAQRELRLQRCLRRAGVDADAAADAAWDPLLALEAAMPPPAPTLRRPETSASAFIPA